MRTREHLRGNKNIAGLRIEYLRKEQGLRQKDILESLEMQGILMTGSVLSKIEGGHRAICDYELLAIANALGVSPDDLLGGNNIYGK